MAGAPGQAFFAGQAGNDLPAESLQRRRRAIQSWLDVQRARGGAEESAKARWIARALTVLDR